jgi:iron complex outermembrane receptor protein
MNFTTSFAPKISSRLLLSSAALPMLLASSAAFAQSAPAAPPAGETVVVTGSLIARPDYNTATPTVSVTSDTLKQSGQIALEAGLKDLPQFSTSTGGSGSFIGGSGQKNLSLRGLGPQRNLVLLDGRRLLPSNSDGTVDINQLPAGIVGNVEIITGGASAVYGSDAVSGVVNFKTKRPADGLEVSATYGTTEAFGGSQYDVNAIGGINTADGRGNITMAVEYTKVTHVNWGSIPFYLQAHTGVTPLVQGVYLPGSNAPSQAAINTYFAQFGAPAGAVPRNASTGFGFNANGSLFNVGPTTGQPVYNYQPLVDGTGRPLNDVFLGSVRNRSYYFRGTQNPLERWSSFVKGDWALTNDIHFYGQALYTNYNSIVQSDATVTSATQVPTIPVTNPFIPAALAGLLASRTVNPASPLTTGPNQPFSLSKRFLGLGGYRTATNANNVYQFIAGLNGVLGDSMTWDVYASHGQTLNTYSSTGAVRFSVVQQLLNAPDGGNSLCAGGFNPFGNNPASAACQQLAAPEFTNRTALTQDIINADMQGTAFALPAGDVKFALGADYRNISFQFKPDAAVQTGDPFTFNPQAPTAGSSAVREVFGEALIPIIKDVPFFQSVNLDIAARYSDYVLSGGTNTYKGDIDWEVMNGFRLRGGYERAVRAPSVNELFSGNSTYYANRTPQASGAGDPCDTRLRGTNPGVAALCASEGLPLGNSYSTNDNQVPAISSGSTALRPEKADTFTGGMVYQPEIDSPWFQNASISVDYYNITVKNAIAQLDFNTIVNKCFNLDGSNPSYSPTNAFCQLIPQRSPSNGQMVNVRTPFANTGGYKTSGIDLEANWLTDIGEATGLGSDAGTLSWDIVGNYLNSFKQQILPGSPWQELAETNTGGGLTSTSTLGPFPKYQTNTRITYHNFGADIGLRWRMIGGMRDTSVVTNAATTVPGQGVANYFDATIGYGVPDTQTHFSLVINNLFDRTPSQTGAFPGSTNANLYSVLGRTYLLTVDQKF